MNKPNNPIPKVNV